MISNYFYHEILRKTIIAFGTLFNNIEIKHKNSDGSDFSVITVPIAYGPVQKFLARLEEVQDPRRRKAITLPRMAFELIGISYDSSRKVSTMQTFKAVNSDTNKIIKSYMPVPYNMSIRLSIITKLNEDALQVVEQILPYFQPSYTLTIDLIKEIGEKRDIPMILENITIEDDYEGDFTTRRSLIYNLDFTAKTYLFGPVGNGNEGLIKKVQVDHYTDVNRVSASRQLRYTAEPRALKDYNNDQTTTLAQNINESVTEFNVSDATSLIEGSYIYIGNESMFIKKISSNTLIVNRSQDGSTASSHYIGDPVDVINKLDDDLLEPGDDFGFSEQNYEFSDGRIYSASKGIDV